CGRLREFAAGKAADDVHHGMVPHRTHRRPAPTPDEMQAMESDARHGDYSHMLGLWVQGMNYDWTRLYEADAASGHALPARIELPAYPFARETYWIDSV